MDKLTTRLQTALSEAGSLAVGRDHQFVEQLHVLIALLDQQGGGVRPLLAQSGVDVNALRVQLGDMLARRPTVTGGDAGDVQIDNELARTLNVTDKLAQKRGDQYISSELFVLAVLEPAAPSRMRSSPTAPNSKPSKRPSPRSGAATPFPTPMPKKTGKPWRSTPSISPRGPSKASSTR